MSLINIENEFTNYERPLNKDRETIKSNIGKKILYVDRIDPNRGYYSIISGVIDAVRYNQVYLDNYNSQFDIRDLKDLVIEK